MGKDTSESAECIQTHEKDQPGLEQGSSEVKRGLFLGTVKVAVWGCHTVTFNDSIIGYPLDLHKEENTMTSLSDSCIFQHRLLILCISL